MSALGDANDRTLRARDAYDRALRELAWTAEQYLDALDGTALGGDHAFGLELLRERRLKAAALNAAYSAAVAESVTIGTHHAAVRALHAAGKAGPAVRPMAVAS